MTEVQRHRAAKWAADQRLRLDKLAKARDRLVIPSANDDPAEGKRNEPSQA